MAEPITLRVDGQIYEGWQKVRITRSLRDIAGGVSERFDAVLFAVLPAPLGWVGIAAITLAGILVLPRAPRTRTAA